MKLRDIINKYKDKYNTIYVQYNTWFENEELFAGACKYENSELISMDQDTYSMNDVFDRYEVESKIPGQEIVINAFYASEWR